MLTETPGKGPGWTIPKRIQMRMETTADGKTRIRRLVPGGKGSTAYPSIFSRLIDPNLDALEAEGASFVPDEWQHRCDRMSQLCTSILKKYRFPDTLEATIILENDAWQKGSVPYEELGLFKGTGARVSTGAATLAERYPGSPPSFAYWALVSIDDANQAYSRGEYRYALGRAADAGFSVMKALFAEYYERHAVVGRKVGRRNTEEREGKRTAPSRDVLMVEIRTVMSNQKVSFSKATKEVSKKHSIHETQIRKMFKAAEFKDIRKL